MAFLKKYIDKYTYMFIVGVTNAIIVAITAIGTVNPILVGFIITVANLALAWIGVETQGNVDANMESAHINAGD
jgi:ABC-type amino acid transport system permease subunit